MAVTLDTIVQKARELAYDRIPSPLLYILKKESDYTLDVTNTSLSIKDSSATVLTELDFVSYPTMQDIFSALFPTTFK